MTNPQPLVSVITPVYNEEAYLAECIDSVISQDYQNWDYTIVDNCSTDRSFEIAKSYAGKDSRIKVVRNDAFVSAIENHNLPFGKSHRTAFIASFCRATIGFIPNSFHGQLKLPIGIKVLEW